LQQVADLFPKNFNIVLDLFQSFFDAHTTTRCTAIAFLAEATFIRVCSRFMPAAIPSERFFLIANFSRDPLPHDRKIPIRRALWKAACRQFALGGTLCCFFDARVLGKPAFFFTIRAIRGSLCPTDLESAGRSI
jgi:hypothetical protein